MPTITIHQALVDSMAESREEAFLLECVSDWFALRTTVYGTGDLTKASALQAQLDKVPDWAQLSGPQQTIMFDSYFQEGNLDGSAADFVSAAMDNDEDAETALLVAKTKSSSGALASRGKRELAYFGSGG